MLIGTVLRARSGFHTVALPAGTLECQVRGRLKRERQNAELVVVGDRVEVRPLTPETGVIESILPRQSRFSRRQPGPRGVWREDLLVANLDQVVAVFACADPRPNPRLIDRFLVVAEHNGVDAVLVANKEDLGPDGQAIFEPYRRIGYPVLVTSAHLATGLDDLRARLAGRITALSGPSGVGKSSLLNAIAPGLALSTGAVSASLHKGRHVTTAAELIPLPPPVSGYVADTPGIRELGLWDVPPADLGWCFREFRPFIGSCRFADCAHATEPGCGVRQAVTDGRISVARYESYERIRAAN